MTDTGLVVSEFDPENPPPLTKAERDQLARLAVLRDEDIDYSDIPPADPDKWLTVEQAEALMKKSANAAE